MDQHGELRVHPVDHEAQATRRGEKSTRWAKPKARNCRKISTSPGEAGHQVARLGPVVIGERKRLQPLVQAVAQNVDRVGAEEVAQIRAAVLKTASKQFHGDDRQSQPRKLDVTLRSGPGR